MKQVSLGGPSGVRVNDVPAPSPGPGEVLVRTAHSLISTGTEGSGVKRAAANAGPPLQRILNDPKLVRRAVSKLMREGVGVIAKPPAAIADTAPVNPIGYSAAGVVLQVGAGVRRFEPGDIVACAGGGYALHAEYISVPENLVVKVPSGVETSSAAFVTLGAVAMQGVRRAEVSLGDRVGIVGLGLLGQIGAQIATAAGGRVIGFDLASDRVELALELGAADGIVSSAADPVDAAMCFSEGVGLDSVIIYAGTSSSALVNQAFEMCRERGKVVVVGDIGLDVERATFYNREQDLLISRSYGPGRYDSSYEEDGLDYPIAYVRWTENRNMDEFVRLVADGRVRVEPLIASIHPIADAEKAYAQALSASGAAVATLLSYTPAEQPLATPPQRFVTVNKAAVTGGVRFGVIGAGAFARSFHIPNLMAIEGASVHAVAARTGSSATTSARKAGSAYATTDHTRIIEDSAIDAVVISTRHDSHAALSIEAARAGKHVFVEKPLGLTAEECAEVSQAVAESGVVLTVGFNRRYSPHARAVKKALASARGPKLMTYRINAGHKDPSHWVYDPIEGGGRIIGEACHFFDLLTYFAECEPVRVTASALGGLGAEYAAYDNMSITLDFEDGSVGHVLYAGNGASEFPKERVEIFCDKRAMAIDDFLTTSVVGAPGVGDLKTKKIDKGHLPCMQAFVDAVAGKSELDMGVVDGARGTIVALAALESAHTRMPVDVPPLTPVQA